MADRDLLQLLYVTSGVVLVLATARSCAASSCIPKLAPSLAPMSSWLLGPLPPRRRVSPTARLRCTRHQR